MNINYGRHYIDNSDIKSVVKALRENWISGDGPYVKKFEESFKFVKRK